ncbi:MAG: glycosyltransferase family 39 protein [Solirubrobacteraceae bacterium]|nr:glycosyltransferase family 39 protein [Solirubrobacteraceae bacterium]
MTVVTRPRPGRDVHAPMPKLRAEPAVERHAARTAQGAAVAARRELALLAVILLAGLFVRGLVAQRGLWLDETITYTQIHGLSLSEVVSRQFNGVHPPLFHILTSLWTGVVGDSPLGMRSLSIAWSAVGILAVWAWSKEAMPARSGLPAAALAAFSPFAVWYGTEARMYAQLFALAAITGWLVWRTMARGASTRRIVGLTLVATAFAFTHYFALLIIGSLGVIALSQVFVAEHRRRALAMCGALATSVGLLAIWGVVVALSRTAEPLTTVFAKPDFFTVVIAGLEMLTGFHDYVSLGIAAAAWPLLCVAVIVALPHLGRPHWRTAGLALCVGLPIAALIAAAVLRSSSVFDSRYLTVAVPAAYVLGGRVWLGIGAGRIRAVLAAVLIAAGIASTVQQNYDRGNPRLYGLRDAITTVNTYARPGDGVLIVPEVLELNGTDPVLGYYPLAPGLRRFDTTPEGRAGTVAPEEMLTRLRETFPRRIWVVYGYDALSYAAGGDQRAGETSGGAISAEFDGFLSGKSKKLASVRFPNVTLTAYEMNWRGER